MKQCVLQGRGLVEDGIFKLTDPGNRDGSHQPYLELAKRLYALGYEIHTPDRLTSAPYFKIHMNAQQTFPSETNYLLLLETPAIWPENRDISNDYRKVFTWRDDILDGDRFVKLNFPNSIVLPEIDGFVSRTRFCCMIASNKATAVHEPNELYSERVRAIQWFENFAPNKFDLYGSNWDLPPVQHGLYGKLQKQIFRVVSHFMRPSHFSSYRGKIDQKQEVLKRTRFSICYENVCNLQGYITEKIFDCFFSGCVPVYWGASNITSHIPPDCFIDRRQFNDTEEIYDFLRAMNEQEFIGYQERIFDFLRSGASYPFSEQCFAETIVKTIVQDLEVQS